MTKPKTPTKAEKITTILASYSVVSPIKSQKSIKSNLTEPQLDIAEESVSEFNILYVELIFSDIEVISFDKELKVFV